LIDREWEIDNAITALKSVSATLLRVIAALKPAPPVTAPCQHTNAIILGDIPQHEIFIRHPEGGSEQRGVIAIRVRQCYGCGAIFGKELYHLPDGMESEEEPTVGLLGAIPDTEGTEQKIRVILDGIEAFKKAVTPRPSVKSLPKKKRRWWHRKIDKNEV
jgi:hypothetical protein